jgi:hypothetical protein
LRNVAIAEAVNNGNGCDAATGETPTFSPYPMSSIMMICSGGSNARCTFGSNFVSSTSHDAVHFVMSGLVSLFKAASGACIVIVVIVYGFGKSENT